VASEFAVMHNVPGTGLGRWLLPKVLHCELIRRFEFPRTCSASRRRIRSRECEGDTMRWATKQRNLRCRASREIRAKVKIDGEAGTGHHSA
jgi:hypothetical protein